MRTLAAVLGAVSLLLQFTHAQVTLSSLLVENQVAPLGIDVSPRFSWRISSSARSVAQSTYRLTISTVSPGASDIWDSGTLTSAKPYLAPYSGPALVSDTLYFWTVAVTTTAGSASASSNFTTGFLAQSDWGASAWIGKNVTLVPQALMNAFTSASWIWPPAPGQIPPSAPPGDVALRLTYTVPAGKTAASATIVATADDLFTLYANGVLVGSAPNTTDAWMSAQIFKNVDLGAASPLVFAVRATNRPDVSTGGAGPAGLLFALS
ncbi:hypothetical protein GGX14DRAFT_53894 [Mycena pura]|uniref:Uncharacterized protein n=1 Tax=Mycena pura TaxID=153505 RepID=A0AAD6UQY8_9AGAR|nr:hypothetical protein GGX14DRAFT_53894 [Mycena pura]